MDTAIAVILLAVSYLMMVFASYLFAGANLTKAKEVSVAVGKSLVTGSLLGVGGAVTAALALDVGIAFVFVMVAFSIFILAVGVLLIAFGVSED